MYEKILVPLDGSQLAEIALPYAEEMAGRLGSEIVLLSVAGSAGAREYHHHQIYVERKSGETRHNAEKCLEGQKERKINVTSVTLVGHPAEEIVNYADREDIGLIIMATHGLSGIRRWALGGVVDKVVRAARQPVALVRAKDPGDVRDTGILDKLLALLDGSKESEAVLPYIEELALLLKAEVTLLHVVPQNNGVSADVEAYLDKVCNLLRDKGVSVRCEIRVGDAAEESIRLADEIETDMVAMTTHGRSGVGRWSLGSVAEKVLQGGNTPVLLVRAG